MQRRLILTLLAGALCAKGETSRWLSLVSPIMSASERTHYVALAPEARNEYEKEFWATKAISQAEYFERLQTADDRFGSGKHGSGLNTDQGRVYVSIGPPNRIVRLPSSRTFYPVEIWYYESLPALQISSELRLLFYEKNGVGDPKLYSPTLDRITSLMTPQANTVGMFGPNQSITQADVATQLTTHPVENEVAEAAISIAPGLKDVGNDEILALVASPSRALSRNWQRPVVQSRLLLGHAPIQMLQTPSPYQGFQVDVCLPLRVQKALQLEVRQAGIVLQRSDAHFTFEQPQVIRYRYRLDLLPGDYALVAITDGKPYAYPLHVGAARHDSEIILAEDAPNTKGDRTPFSFAGRALSPSHEGLVALLATADEGAVSWMLRHGTTAVWKTQADPKNGISIVELPLNSLAHAEYTLEAATANGTHSMTLDLTGPSLIGRSAKAEVTVSYNANLSEAQRYSLLAHQWLARGNIENAKHDLELSLAAQPDGNDQALVELSRIDAYGGNLDASRERLRTVLAREPRHFEALTVLAYVEAELQDYPQAATLYREALSIQESPAVRLALERLPAR